MGIRKVCFFVLIFFVILSFPVISLAQIDSSLALKLTEFTQAANDDPTLGAIHWISSVLQESNSRYYEGMSVCQRLILNDVSSTPGDTHALTMSVDATKSGIHAYDFLTSWDNAIPAADSTAAGQNLLVDLFSDQCDPEFWGSTQAICDHIHSLGLYDEADLEVLDMGSVGGDNVQLRADNYDTYFGVSRTIKIWGNSAVSSASITFDGYTGSPNDKSANYTLHWTSASDTVIIEMAGHLAAGIDPLEAGIGYGEGQGAASISGGPYHFGLSQLDGSSLGSQDNQIKGADVLLPAIECNVTPASDSVCVGFDAAFTDHATGGTQPYSWVWTKPPDATVLSADSILTISDAALADSGQYRVIVTDSAGTADTCYAYLTVSPLPVLSCAGDEVTCDSLLASATVTSNPSSGVSYLWTPEPASGQGTAHARYFAAGTKKVVVTVDATGCKDSCEAVITQDITKPVLSCAGDTLTCDSTLASATVTSNPSTGVSYLWTPAPVSGQGTAHARYDAPGTKKVVVTIDATGCKDSCEAIITEDATKPQLSWVGDELTCDSTLASATVTSNPSSGISYLWTPAPVSGQGTAHARYNAPGTKKVVVTVDATGCKDSCEAIITEDATKPQLSWAGDELTCDSTLASATVTSNPSSGVSYLWTPAPVSGQGTAHARYNAPGTKKVVVTIDATGCKDSCEAVIMQDITKPVLSCAGDTLTCDSILASATVTSNPSSGVSYLWTPAPVSGQGTAHARYNAPGIKKVVVTVDATGCKDSCEAVITEEGTKPQLSWAGDELTCDSTLASATVTSNPSSGVSYLWTPAPVSGQGTAHARYDAPGTKKVVVTIDATGCKDSCEAVITQDITKPVLSCAGDTLTCDSTLASATVTSNPSSGVSYLWTPVPVSGQGTAHARYNAPGTKKVVVTIDATGCKDSCEAVITEDVTKPVLSCAGDTLTCDSTLASATVTSNPSSGVSYLWTPAPVSGQGTAHARYDAPGTKKVVVTIDATGCKDSCEAVITEDVTKPQLSCAGDELTCDSTLASAMVTSNPSVGVSYLWTPAPVSGQGTAHARYDAPGTKKVVVTIDATGCKDSCEAIITEDATKPQLSWVGDELTCDSTLASATVTSNPSSGVSYLWTPAPVSGQGTAHARYDAPGTKRVVVTIDATGCKDSCEAVITEDVNEPPIVDVPSDTSIFLCEPETLCFPISFSDPDSPIMDVSINSPWYYRSTDTSVCLLASSEMTYCCTVIVTDSCQAADTGIFCMTVDLNDSPQLTSPDTVEYHLADTSTVCFDITLYDPDDGLTVTVNPPGQYNPSDSSICFLADRDTAYNFIIIATDNCGTPPLPTGGKGMSSGFASADTSYTVAIVNINDPPVIIAPDTVTFELCDTSTVCFDITLYDPDDGLTVLVNPPGQFNSSDSSVCFFADRDTTYDFTMIVSDTCGKADTAHTVALVNFNQPPELTVPDDVDTSLCQIQAICITGIIAADPDAGDTVTLEKIKGPGVFNPITGVSPLSAQVCFTPAGVDSTYEFTLRVTNHCGAFDEESFNVTVNLNQPPTAAVQTSKDTVDVCPDQPYTVTVVGNDPNTDCDISLEKTEGPGSFSPISGKPPLSGAYTWTPVAADTLQIHRVIFEVVDHCGLSDQDTLWIRVKTPLECECEINVSIDTVDCVFPGGVVEVSVNLFTNLEIGGFKLYVEYDPTVMTFLGVERGDLIDDFDGYYDDYQHTRRYDFQYFNHRMLPCAQQCETYKIKIVGIADMPDGQINGPLPASQGELIKLRFQVAKDANLQDLFLPVKFEFDYDFDLKAPSFSSATGETLYVDVNWPGETSDPNHNILPLVCFIDGGVKVCSDAFAWAGDINMNEYPYEIADAVLFSNYFMSGPGVFDIDPEIQTLATDVNQDGLVLSMSDFVFLIRIILEDISPKHKLAPSADLVDITLTTQDDAVKVTSNSGSITGAGLYVFRHSGEVKNLTVNTDMSIKFNDVNGELRVLLYSFEGKAIPAGAVELFSFEAEDVELVEVDAADFYGSALKSTISNKVLPARFVLMNNYPNPFNLSTSISFAISADSKVSLKLYNIAGRLVQAFEGEYQAGAHTVVWDGTNTRGETVASGIYLYRLVAGEYTCTRKMVLMK